MSVSPDKITETYGLKGCGKGREDQDLQPGDGHGKECGTMELGPKNEFLGPVEGKGPKLEG